MEGQPIDENLLYPVHINSFAIPNDTALKCAYDVYKPSLQTIKLLSERGRTLYPEVFIENSRLGPLTNLCAEVLARSFGPHPSPLVASNPLLLQIHYDALDVDLPLAKCYDIAEARFWKRVVLTKHKDKALAIRRNINWKNLGVSLKYVELVEECPVEYWPADEMKELALKVKEFVREMHIKRLQSLKERSFEKYFQSGSESISDESGSQEDLTLSSSGTSIEERGEASELEEKTQSQLELKEAIARKKAQRKQERQKLREAKRIAQEAKQAKRKLSEAKHAAERKENKKPLKKIPDSVFDIEVSESEDDGEDRIVDKRNKALLLRHMKKYNYPAKDCHHIDLRFVQHFVHLETFAIEFLGPIQNRNYQNRHLNFSYDDIKHLAIGLSHLSKLKTFRLRNSRMDTEKLQILCGSLGLLPSLETLDFGCDQLTDDCGTVLKEFLQITETLKNLELESNCLGEQALREIGKALSYYSANELLYLGLARNPITDEALHALVSNIIGTKHIQELNMRGATFVTDVGLCCCLANELLKHHPALIKLDISAIQISQVSATEIVKSLDKNKTILEFYCSGCELDKDTEIDIKVILRRNKYISENHYLRDPTATEEEIIAWLNRIRNPILLKVLAEREAHSQASKTPSPVNSAAESHYGSLDRKTQGYDGHLNTYSSVEREIHNQPTERYILPANEYDEQQFLEHVYQPGPQERYYYLKTFKQKYLLQDDVKNKSII